jgi:hypothetical protein
MPFDEIFKECFKTAGGSLVGKAFNQSEGAKLIPEDKRPARKIDGGYCRGACLDWLRRILIRGEMGSEEKRFVVKDTSPDRVQRMAQAWAKPYDAEDKLLSEDTKLVKASNDARETFITYLKLKKNYEERPGEGLTYTTPKGDKEFDKLYGAYDAANKQLDVSRQSSGLARGGPLQAVWKDQAKILDDEYKRKKYPDQSKGFGQISVLVDKSPTDDKSVGEYACTVVALPEFYTGAGILLGVDFEERPNTQSDWTKAKAGHAIALFRDTKDAYLLFDPNLGVYRFAGADKMLLGLLTLFSVGYNDPKSRVAEAGFQGRYNVFVHSGFRPPMDRTPDRAHLSREKDRFLEEQKRKVEEARRKQRKELEEALCGAEVAERAYKAAKTEKDNAEKAQAAALAKNNALVAELKLLGAGAPNYQKKFTEYESASAAFGVADKAYKVAYAKYESFYATYASTHDHADGLRVAANMSKEEAAAIRAKVPQTPAQGAAAAPYRPPAHVARVEQPVQNSVRPLPSGPASRPPLSQPANQSGPPPSGAGNVGTSIRDRMKMFEKQ